MISRARASLASPDRHKPGPRPGQSGDDIAMDYSRHGREFCLISKTNKTGAGVDDHVSRRGGIHRCWRLVRYVDQ